MATAADQARAVSAVLTQWQGEQAQFWSYTAALATLEVRLFSRRRPGNAHLVCSPCVAIAGPVYWEPCALRVTADGSDDSLFLVEDQAARVRVLCRQIYICEDVEPLFSPRPGKENGESVALHPGKQGEASCR